MASQKQIEANRRNAQKSTGPCTSEGRARASMNALRHGLTAAAVVLEKEDQGAYQAIREQLFRDYAPVDNVECMLVNQLVAAYWRTIRSRRIEKAILDGAEADILDAFNSHFQTYFRYDAAISRDYHRALRALERAQQTRAREERRAGAQPEAAASAEPVHAVRPEPAEPEAQSDEIGFVSHGPKPHLAIVARGAAVVSELPQVSNFTPVDAIPDGGLSSH
jgi:hypothetical protein